jgi:hypothetical protein
MSLCSLSTGICGSKAEVFHTGRMECEMKDSGV